MKTYLSNTHKLIKSSVIQGLDWPEMRLAIDETISNVKDPTNQILPILMCELVGGRAEDGYAICASWILFRIASNIFDDIQDQDVAPEEIWSSWSLGNQLMVAVGLLGAANTSLSYLPLEAEALKDAYRTIGATSVVAAQGQAAAIKQPTLSQYFQGITRKTGLVSATLLKVSAQISTTDPQAIQAAYQFGLAYGTLVQICDDVFDLGIGHDNGGDLKQSIQTLPIIYALSRHNHPRHPELENLIPQVKNNHSEVLPQVFDILVEMKAFHFCYNVVLEYKQMMLSALDTFPKHRTSYLRTYVENLFEDYRTMDRANSSN